MHEALIRPWKLRLIENQSRELEKPYCYLKFDSPFRECILKNVHPANDTHLGSDMNSTEYSHRTAAPGSGGGAGAVLGEDAIVEYSGAEDSGKAEGTVLGAFTYVFPLSPQTGVSPQERDNSLSMLLLIGHTHTLSLHMNIGKSFVGFLLSCQKMKSDLKKDVFFGKRK
ncbi:hypothetical protein MJT46_011082 [Ovis ammon polii x Ovis aries]|nr:hypothetical protein MJT46_011082 [Ovis ammon polii x Ovis aries]